MTGSEEFGIQSIPPRYDINNSYYIYTSEGYTKAVEEIETEEREIAEAELQAIAEQNLETEEIERLEQIQRENEKQILTEIKLKDMEVEQQLADLSEYDMDEEIPPGSTLDLLA